MPVRDEDNFVNILKKSTYSEILEYKEKEVAAIEPEEMLEPLPQRNQNQVFSESAEMAGSDALTDSDSSVEQWVSNTETALLDLGSVTTRSQRNQMDLIARQISERRMRDMRVAEKFALERLEKELGVSIDREMRIESGHFHVQFDGIARRGSSLTAIEVKYFRSRRSAPMNMAMWGQLRRSLETETVINFVCRAYHVSNSKDYECHARERTTAQLTPHCQKFQRNCSTSL